MTTDQPPTQPAAITFQAGLLRGQTIALTKLVMTLGRDPTNDIVVDEPGVAPRHARLVKGDAAWRVEKLDAPAGSLTIGGRPVERAFLREGAVIGLGATTAFAFSERPAAVAERRPLAVPAARPASIPPSVPPAPAGPTGAMAAPPQRSPERRSTSGPRQSDGRNRPDSSGPNETELVPFAQLGPAGAGVPCLEVKSERGRRLFPLAGATIDIGRDPANAIVLDERVVSGRHLRIRRDGGRFVLVHPHPDRGKTLNGLLYQGRQIRGDEPFARTLANGDVFRIGDEQGTLVTLTYFDGTGVPELAPPVRPVRLGEPVYSIGRKPDNAIVLAHPQVSALHALLMREGGTYRLLDQGSTNHVYVNGEPTTNHLLELGDEIRIGPYRLVYEVSQLRQYDESKFIGIQAMDLRKTGTGGVVLLDDISLCVRPRQFVALVGGSGAGKSTLMDALNGLRPAQQGKVLYNGHDFYRNRFAYTSQLGYVPQDDIVHKDLSVERALYYAARLRLPSDFTDEQIEQRIREVLEDVEMTARRALPVKKLSGGQRKRVSIALELLANPSVFFLDEPTSGLDPGLDRKMMLLLRKLADKGHTIVLVTHATANIGVCDAICFLAQGGRLAYFGPPDEAKVYFGKDDFAEIYTSLEPTDEDADVPAAAAERFRRSPQYQAYVAAPLAADAVTAAAAPAAPAAPPAAAPAKAGARAPRRPNPFKQFALLTARNIELLRNNPINLALLLLQAPVLALLFMVLIRGASGGGLFDSNKVVQCAPQILQSVVTIAPTPENPTGTVRLGIDTSKARNPEAPVDCAEIRKLLSGDPNSKADPAMVEHAKEYTRIKGQGNVAKALQDFIIPGTSGAALSTIFIIGFVAVLFGCINGIREIVKEASIYRRERAVNLGLLPYVWSKIAFLGAFAVLQSAALVFIAHAFEPFRTGIFLPVLVEVYITVLLTALAGTMLGLAVSTYAANEDSANTLLPFVLIPQVIFSGSQFALKDGPLQVVAMFVPVRWTMVALGSIVGLHSDRLGGDRVLGDDQAFHGTLFSTFSQSDATRHLEVAWAALVVTMLVLGLLVCLGLKRKDAYRG